jgi:hypothetical protein
VKAYSEAQASKHFGIPRTTLRGWKSLSALPRDKAKLTKKGKHAHRGAGRPLSYNADMEQLIVQWILEARDLQLPVQRKMIQRKAMAIISPEHPNFRASDGWLQKFMRRNSLSLRKHTSIQQNLPAGLERKLEKFIDEVKTFREQHNFPDNLIINMDETPIFFDMPRSSTVTGKGAKEVRIRGTKGGKKRVTYVVSCSAAGEMLKPMVIFKGKTKQTLKNTKQRERDVLVTFQAKGWMDQGIMRKWIKSILTPHTKVRHCLLVFDSFRAHLTDEVLQSLAKVNTTVVVIPGGCTSKVQPVDVSLNKPIKDIVRGLWEDLMVQHVNQSTTSSAPSVSKDDIVDWIVRANTLLSTQGNCVTKSFKVCGLTNALDGTENHLIRCAKELPEFTIPYGVSAEESESDEDIFADTDEEEEQDYEDEEDEEDEDVEN